MQTWVVVMEQMAWRDFRARYPDVAAEILRLGAILYEMGADSARAAPELAQLTETLRRTTDDIRSALGFNGKSVEPVNVLTAIFEHGSSLLLDYVRNGNC